MISLKLYLITALYMVNGEKDQQNKLLGLQTSHNVIIDKDTIITRNMNLKNKNLIKDAKNINTRDPDWSYSSFPKEVKSHVDEFKRNMSECLKEVQKNDNRPVKRLSPNKDSPVHGECLIACVLKRNGVIQNGKIHKESLLKMVMKFFAKEEKLIKKLEKNLDRCIEISVKSKDDCAVAARLNECTNDLMANNKHKITVNY